MCPQAAGHVAAAAGEVLGAAESYVRTKCSRRQVEERCRAAGVVFQPMIFESTGGVSAEAERVLKCLNKAVAGNTDSSEDVIATRFWQRIGVDLLRGGSRAFQRRIGDKSGDDGSGVRYFQGAAGLAVAVGT